MAKVNRPQGSPVPDTVKKPTPNILPSDIAMDGGIEDQRINKAILNDEDEVADQIALGNMGGGAGVYALRQGAGFLFKTIEQGNGVELEVGKKSIKVHSRPRISDISGIPEFNSSTSGKTLRINDIGNGVDWTFINQLVRSYRVGSLGISGNRVVKMSNDIVSYPDINTDIDGEFILGITISAAGPDEEVDVQFAGQVTEPSWNWNIGAVFCGHDGHLTQTPPPGKWLRQIGTAVASDTVLISLRPLIITLGD